MNKIGLALTVAVTASVAAPAFGQSLAERIAAIKQKQQQEQQSSAAGENSTRAFLQTLFHRKLSVKFDSTPAREVFDYFKTAMNVNLIVRYDTDPVGFGIDPLTPITLEAKGMLFVDILDLALEQCSTVEECTWQLRRSFIEIGTKERLSAPAAQVMRVYPVDDILYEPPSFTDSTPVGIDFGPSYSAGGYGVYGGFGGRYGHGGRRYGRGGRRYGGGYGGGFGVASSFGGQPSAGYGGGLNVGPTGGSTSTQTDMAMRAESLIDLIIETVEPMGWVQNGGDWATIKVNDGGLLIRAPDFVHRQLSGYPNVPPPHRSSATPTSPPTGRP